MRLTTVVVMVALVGCAGPARREFRDGAPVRAAPVEPVTTYTPVGAGLPEYWGSPAPSVECSPHTRVLPETPGTRREDGLWAVKEPDDHPELLDGAYLPLPPDGNPTYRDRCAKEMSLALMISDRGVARRAIDSRRHQCMAARLWSACMEQLAHEMPKMGADDVVLARVEASRAFAAANAKDQCRGAKVPDNDVDGLVGKAVRQWMAFPRR